MKNIKIFKNIILLLLLAVCAKLFTDRYFTKVSEKEFAELKSSYQNLLEIRKSIDSFIQQTAVDEGRQIIINKSPKYSKYNIVQYNKSIDTTPLLAIRISPRHCSYCVEDLLSIVKNNIPEKFSDKVVVLTDFSRPVYAQSFMSEHKDFPFAMRNRVISEMGLKSESINLPFMFIIDKANKIRQVFAHVKEDKTRTVHYLKAVLNNYLN